jgi:hypothetical protein
MLSFFAENTTGNKSVKTKNFIGFENIKQFLSNRQTINNKIILLINTLSTNEQNILIVGTIPYQQEEEILNKIIEQNECKKYILYIYGKNCLDDTVITKFHFLCELGFVVYVYIGGLFEWLMLQELYGVDEFPTSSTTNDIIKYRPLPRII